MSGRRISKASEAVSPASLPRRRSCLPACRAMPSSRSMSMTNGCGGWRRCSRAGRSRSARDADVRARAVVDFGTDGIAFDLVVAERAAKVRLRCIGQHNVTNALAAAAIGHAMGLEHRGHRARLGAHRCDCHAHAGHAAAEWRDPDQRCIQRKPVQRRGRPDGVAALFWATGGGVGGDVGAGRRGPARSPSHRRARRGSRRATAVLARSAGRGGGGRRARGGHARPRRFMSAARMPRWRRRWWPDGSRATSCSSRARVA